MSLKAVPAPNPAVRYLQSLAALLELEARILADPDRHLIVEAAERRGRRLARAAEPQARKPRRTGGR